MTGTTDERQVRELLRIATSDLGEPNPVLAPITAVLEGGRRRQRAARLRATAVLALAAAVLLPVAGVLPAGQPLWDRSTSRVEAAAPVIDPEHRTVQLGAVTVTVPDGWAIQTTGSCARPRTVLVLTRPGLSACGKGPSITVTAKSGRGWAPFGSSNPGALNGLIMLGDAPVWRGVSSDWLVLSIPYGPEFVEVNGTAKQQDQLLRRISVAALADQPVLSSRQVVMADAGNSRGTIGGSTEDPATLRSLVTALESAERVETGSPCVPAQADQVTLSLQTSMNSDPETGPVGEFTTLITAFKGPCRLAFSSTGAVVAPGPEFRQLLSHLMRA